MVWVVPLLIMEFIPHALTPAIRNNGIWSLIGFGNLVGSLVHSVLYRHYLSYARLALKLFRGEPAITDFD